VSKSSLPLFNSDTSPWYKEGLRFECTGCGQCCTGSPGYVWVSEADIQAISDYLKIPLEEFSKKYLRKVGNRYSLLEKAGNFDCIFLEGKKCKIYPVRPIQCSTYPWWPELVESPERWQETAYHCEGIRSDAPKVSQQEIDAQLEVYTNNHPQEE